MVVASGRISAPIVPGDVGHEHEELVVPRRLALVHVVLDAVEAYALDRRGVDDLQVGDDLLVVLLSLRADGRHVRFLVEGHDVPRLVHLAVASRQLGGAAAQPEPLPVGAVGRQRLELAQKVRLSGPGRAEPLPDELLLADAAHLEYLEHRREPDDRRFARAVDLVRVRELAPDPVAEERHVLVDERDGGLVVRGARLGRVDQVEAPLHAQHEPRRQVVDPAAEHLADATERELVVRAPRVRAPLFEDLHAPVVRPLDVPLLGLVARALVVGHGRRAAVREGPACELVGPEAGVLRLDGPLLARLVVPADLAESLRSRIVVARDEVAEALVLLLELLHRALLLLYFDPEVVEVASHLHLHRPQRDRVLVALGGRAVAGVHVRVEVTRDEGRRRGRALQAGELGLHHFPEHVVQDGRGGLARARSGGQLRGHDVVHRGRQQVEHLELLVPLRRHEVAHVVPRVLGEHDAALVALLCILREREVGGELQLTLVDLDGLSVAVDETACQRARVAERVEGVLGAQRVVLAVAHQWAQPSLQREVGDPRAAPEEGLAGALVPRLLAGLVVVELVLRVDHVVVVLRVDVGQLCVAADRLHQLQDLLVAEQLAVGRGRVVVGPPLLLLRLSLGVTVGFHSVRKRLVAVALPGADERPYAIADDGLRRVRPRLGRRLVDFAEQVLQEKHRLAADHVAALGGLSSDLVDVRANRVERRVAAARVGVCRVPRPVGLPNVAIPLLGRHSVRQIGVLLPVGQPPGRFRHKSQELRGGLDGAIRLFRRRPSELHGGAADFQIAQIFGSIVHSISSDIENFISHNGHELPWRTIDVELVPPLIGRNPASISIAEPNRG